jgi:hypothetical protein
MILYMVIKIIFNSYFLLSELNISLTKVFKNHLDPILGKIIEIIILKVNL